MVIIRAFIPAFLERRNEDLGASAAETIIQATSFTSSAGCVTL